METISINNKMLSHYLGNEYSNKWFLIILKNPDKKWDWDLISNNPNITMDIINKYPDKPWNWNRISENPNITMNMIENNLDKPWNWKMVSKNPNLTIDFIDKHFNKYWNWNCIVSNKRIFEEALNNINKEWRFTSIPHCKIKFIKKVVRNPWIIYDSEHYINNVTMEMVIKNPDKPWEWGYIVYFNDLTIEYINILEKTNSFNTFNNQNKSFWWTFSYRSTTTMEMINNNPDKPWCWNTISMNPNLTMEMINNNPDKEWNWNFISCNPNITMNDINNNLDKPWVWEWISKNPNLTMEMINNNLDKEWYWTKIECNPNITFQMIEQKIIELKTLNFNEEIIEAWVRYIGRRKDLTIKFLNNNIDKKIIFDEVSKNNFSIDRKNYINQNSKKILLLALARQKTTQVCYKNTVGMLL